MGIDIFIHEDIDTRIFLHDSSLQTEDLCEASSYYITHNRLDLLPIAVFLKLHSLTRFNNAVDIIVIDNPNLDSRFTLFYLLQSLTVNLRCFLGTYATEAGALVSLQALYPAFNWAEREV